MNAISSPILTAELTVENLLLVCMISARLQDDEIRFLLDTISIKTFKKGTLLLQEGQRPTECYHNIKGCIRQFYLKEGEEKTTFFYTEDQSINANGNDRPVKYYLECIEDTIVSVVSHEKEKELFRKFPRFESLSRMEMEKRISDYQEMLATYIMTSPEERYLNLIKTRPELLDRVPLYQLASYIGIKPETLSRIRKRIMSK